MFSILINAAKSILGNSNIEEPSIDELIERLEESNCNNELVDSSNNEQECPVGCFYKTGIVTSISNDSISIDNRFICDLQNVSIKNVKQGTKVNYIAYQRRENEEIKIRKVLSVCDNFWDNDENNEVVEQNQIMNKCVIAKVVKREGRKVHLDSIDVIINLDEVDSTFVPYVGDWLKLESLLEVDETSNDLSGHILEIDKIQPLRSRIKVGLVSKYDYQTGVGVIEKDTVFTKYSCQPGYIPHIGDKVVSDSIESDQGIYVWRSLTVVPLFHNHQQLYGINNKKVVSSGEKENSSLQENKNGIRISEIPQLNMGINDETDITLFVENSGNDQQIMTKVILDNQSQLSLIYPPTKDIIKVINPTEHVKYVFRCQAKLVGETKEHITFFFNDFHIKHNIYINVNPTELKNQSESVYENNDRKLARQDEYDQASLIPGVRPIKPPNFIKNRNGVFKIPQRYWDIILPCINENRSNEEIESIVGEQLSFLHEGLKPQNYRERFHALLYLEEISFTIDMQRYDLNDASMKHYGEYLALTVPGLVEKRPSLITGDRAIVSFKWDHTGGDIKYEGCIHKIKSCEVLLKFNHKFHETYNGEYCQVTFKSSYSQISRCHNAVNRAVMNMGCDILFPTLVREKQPQIQIKEPNINEIDEKEIYWFNKCLNFYQKKAVKNVLYGVARPTPYVIFGPPGTGKTITLCETILQILNMIPDSRILIATPSNSSANLISERLLDSCILKPGDLVRLVAHHCLDDDSIPERLLPYCATGNLAEEGSTAKFSYSGKGPKINCSMSVLGRHRITVGTCIALGILYNMGFPREHFTHIIVDEAGQATEPEIMVALNFTHSSHGQIILAGDPMQLGPVVNSKIAGAFGLSESFLVRLLNQFPYQRDPEGHKSGYDPRLVTKLLMNYRSLPEILELPNAMFYDSELKPELNKLTCKEGILLKSISNILPAREKGGTPAIVFHGINGENRQDSDSPSWYNPAEATQVYLYLTRLYKHELVPDDIGIITPYRKQVRQIRDLLLELDIALPKIGSVEEFQGQERNIIILSAVRSTKDYVSEDIRHALGFIASPRRLNVAITRARALLIIVGNPQLLSHDPYWRNVIIYCMEKDSYTGCEFSIK